MYKEYLHLKEEKVKYNGKVISIKPQKTVAVALASNQSDKAVCKVNIGNSVKIGTLLGYIDDGVYLPIYSPVSGKVVGFEDYQYCTLQKVKHVIIENDFKDDCIKLFESPLDIQKLKKEEIINFIKISGIVGLSGAGFASYGKYLNDCDTLIINGCECESYLISDKVNVLNNCLDMLEGVLILEKAAGCKEVYIAIKNSELKEIELIEKLIEDNEKYQHIQLCLIDDFYPCGWEKILTNWITGRDYKVYTTECGVIVNNISTAIAIKKIFDSGLPLIDKIITVGGNAVKEQCVIKTRIGTNVGYILDSIGLVEKDVDIYCGGTMMGLIMDNCDFYVASPYNGIIVMKKENNIEGCLENDITINDYCCCDLDVVSLYHACVKNDIEKAKSLNIEDCCECGICSYICRKDIRQTIREVKSKLINK